MTLTKAILSMIHELLQAALKTPFVGRFVKQ